MVDAMQQWPNSQEPTQAVSTPRIWACSPSPHLLMDEHSLGI